MTERKKKKLLHLEMNEKKMIIFMVRYERM